MHKYIKDMVECPLCHHELEWIITDETNERIINGEAKCNHCHATYPIKEEIAIFLTPDLPRNDLWLNSDNYFKRYFNEHPSKREELMNAKIEELHPTDLFVRGTILEDSNAKESRELIKLAISKLYTDDYLKGRSSQFDFIVNHLTSNEPIVDLACGKGYLVEHLAKNVNNYIIATDFSPLILRKDREQFNEMNIGDKISYLSFDARKTPFKNGAVKIMTTFVGLPNIENPIGLLHEIRRIIDGELLAINHFFDLKDNEHLNLIQKNNLETFLYKDKLIHAFLNANFTVENKNIVRASIKPTPPGEFFKFSIDGLPIVDTNIEWCVTCAT